MHAIDALYQEHLARRQLPSRDLIEQHTSGITDEDVSRAIAGRLACALPSAEALDYLRRHLRAPLLTVAAGIGFWAHCLRHVHGIETLATDLHAPEHNPRFRRPGWYPVQPMDAIEALRRYPDHDLLGVCLPPGLSLQEAYEAAPQAESPAALHRRLLFTRRLRRRRGRSHVAGARTEIPAGGLHRPLGPRSAGLSNSADPHLARVTWRKRTDAESYPDESAAR